MKQTIIHEFYVGQHHHYLADDNIIYANTIGAIDDEMAVQFKEKSLCLYAKFDGPIRVLVDLNKAGKQTTLARNVWTDLCNQGERPVRVALWGLHPVAKLLASFYIGLSGNKKCKFFSTKDAAMKWLKEKI